MTPPLKGLAPLTFKKIGTVNKKYYFTTISSDFAVFFAGAV